MNDEKNKKKAEVILSALKGKNQLKEISELCDFLCNEKQIKTYKVVKVVGTSRDKDLAIDYLLETKDQLISIIRGFIETYNYVIDFMSELSAEAIDNINDDQNDGGIDDEKD